MDTNFSPADLAFRDEVRAFLKAAWTDVLGQYPEPLGGIIDVEWQKRLYAQGWIAPNWPVECGGTGWSATQKYIFETERAAVGAPDVSPFGLKMVGPVIYTFGNEEQKKRFLPGILNSEDWWCQGYSEPGAGSDLASLKTKAERDGDDYIVNGAKIWTTLAQMADWMFCLVRTSTEGKPQQGISFLLIDMKTPGITVRPIYTIDEEHHLNEVILDNVRVPVANRIGEENQGWTYAKSLLAHERTAIAGVADSKRHLADLKQLAAAECNGGVRAIDEPRFRHRFADIEAELMALEYTELRVLAAMAKGDGPGVESSLLKLKGTEIQQSIAELRLDLAAAFGAVVQGELSSEQVGHSFGNLARRNFLAGRAATIYGGSDEVQKNITAKFVLGL
ncbi:MAG: acyl-CoA dehydrogenase family protein [Cellvibrionaceae bacterium]|nr:acyl-CoA dehydrogenase family protein [Cellvibrionaceae bacterium]